jgi:Asp-tRNA(Asn)/Glu-tRNA(Gln) amidotransferase A subunit family amidase
VSSSGSAAAVADYMTPLAIGSQTGGSVILPAAFCGLVGYKSSLLGLDRGNVRHLKPSIDTMGLFARTIPDIALFRSVLSSEELVAPVQDLKGVRLGVCRTMYWKAAEAETVQALHNASRALSAAGATLEDVEMPAIFEGVEGSRKIVVDVERIRAMDEETRHHSNELNFRIRDSLEAARHISIAEYYDAQHHLSECRKALTAILNDHDAIITPSTTGEATTDLTSLSNSVFNSLWTIMHVPCVTIPAFEGPNGMPVGVQALGQINADGRLLALAQGIATALEQRA